MIHPQVNPLVRMNSGDDDLENLHRLREERYVAWIVKQNLRSVL